MICELCSLVPFLFSIVDVGEIAMVIGALCIVFVANLVSGFWGEHRASS